MTRLMGPAAVGPNIDECTTNNDPFFPLGSIVEGENGKAYRRVQFVDIGTATYAVNKMAVLADADADEWKVTIDVSGGNAIAGLHPVGVVVAVPDATHTYGWVQIRGVASAVMGSASVIAGDWLMPDSSEDGDIEEATAGTHENICAYALATIADDATGKVMLYNLG